MDRKSIIVIIVCFGLLGLWSYVLVPKLYPPRPLPPGTTNAPLAVLNPTNQPATTPATPTPEAAEPIAKPIVANTNVEERTVELTNGNARYTFTSYGGGAELI